MGGESVSLDGAPWSDRPGRDPAKGATMSTIATEHAGTTIRTHDGTDISYKDWGSGQPVVFSHGWPLNADAWDDQAMLVASNGFRAIDHDRRGQRRSSQPWSVNDMDT